MIRNLKVLGLALVAMLSMSAMVASAAHALPELTAAEAGSAVGEEVGKHEFTVGSRAIQCEEVNFTGPSTTTAQTTLTIVPDYKKCKTTPVFGITLFVTVTMNGCDYLFHATGKDGANYTASVDIVCPAGKLIEAHIYSNAAHTNESCTVTIGPQTGKTTNTITNTAGTPNDLTVHHDVVVNVTIHGSAIVCGSGTTATYEGTSTLKALNKAGTPVGLTASGE
jgi:hypothetical protein